MTEEQKRKKREYNKKWQAANKDKVKAYRKANRERAATTSKEWASRNKEKVRAAQKKWSDANKEKIKLYNAREDRKTARKERQSSPIGKLSAKKSWLKSNYNLSLEDYRGLMESHANCCARCGTFFTHEANETSPQVDHEHDTCHIRGLLCQKCNTGIGLLGDTLEDLEEAVRYLKDRGSK